MKKKKSQRMKKKNIVILVVILAVAIGGTFFFLLIRQKEIKILKNKEQMEGEKSREEMILIPEGDFIMGSTNKEINDAYNLCRKFEGDACQKEDFQAEYPQAEVFLPSFYIDKYEVSNADYEIFARDTGRELPFYLKNSPSDVPEGLAETLKAPQNPVVGVTWSDALEYCLWRKARLPTETEWEKAARGTEGISNPIDTGNCGKGGEPGYNDEDGYLYLAPVTAELGKSPYGVFNIIGNAAEWVEDELAPYQSNNTYKSHRFYEMGYRVFRGGAFIFTEADLRPASRLGADPITQNYLIGFRCAKDAK